MGTGRVGARKEKRRLTRAERASFFLPSTLSHALAISLTLPPFLCVFYWSACCLFSLPFFLAFCLCFSLFLSAALFSNPPAPGSVSRLASVLLLYQTSHLPPLCLSLSLSLDGLFPLAVLCLVPPCLVLSSFLFLLVFLPIRLSRCFAFLF